MAESGLDRRLLAEMVGWVISLSRGVSPEPHMQCLLLLLYAHNLEVASLFGYNTRARRKQRSLATSILPLFSCGLENVTRGVDGHKGRENLRQGMWEEYDTITGCEDCLETVLELPWI